MARLMRPGISRWLLGVLASAAMVAAVSGLRDDGRGADLTEGTGLVGVKDRVEALGGRLYLDSPPDAGTVLRADFPLTGAAGAANTPATNWR